MKPTKVKQGTIRNIFTEWQKEWMFLLLKWIQLWCTINGALKNRLQAIVCMNVSSENRPSQVQLLYPVNIQSKMVLNWWPFIYRSIAIVICKIQDSQFKVGCDLSEKATVFKCIDF